MKSPELIAVVAAGTDEIPGDLYATIITRALPGVPVRVVTAKTVSFAEVLALPELRDASLFVTMINNIYQDGTSSDWLECRRDFIRQLREKTDAVIFVAHSWGGDFSDMMRQAGADFVEQSPFESKVLREIARAACRKWQAVSGPINPTANRVSNVDESMEEYDRLHNIPIDVTGSVTHADFAAGVQNRTVGFKVIRGEPITLVKGFRKAVFNAVVMLYMVGPPIIIPFWAYHERNWWLLVGVLVSWLATAATLRSVAVVIKGKTAGSLLFLACVVFWVAGGIHNYLTFLSLAALWGCVLPQIAEEAQREYAMQSLMESPELFEKAVAQGRIEIVRKETKAP